MENNLNKKEFTSSILFLHGFTQNSLIFQKRLKVLTKTVQEKLPNVNLLFPEAPFILEENNKDVDLMAAETIKRGWLYLNDENRMNSDILFESESVTYLGLETSLKTLVELNKMNNFNIECIFGFSQGAVLALFLTILISKGELKKYFPNLKCIVLVAGFFYPVPNNEEMKFYSNILKLAYNDEEYLKSNSDLRLDIPCLNVYGQKDEFIIPIKSQKVSSLFITLEEHIHEGKHYVPTTKVDVEVLLNFLEKYLN